MLVAEIENTIGYKSTGILALIKISGWEIVLNRPFLT
jgi:hypothetical protein